MVELGPVRGHERHGSRPCVVVSDNLMNHSAMGLSVVVPCTSREKAIRLHVRVDPPEGGLRVASYFMPQHVQSASHERFKERLGVLSREAFEAVARRLAMVFGLD